MALLAAFGDAQEKGGSSSGNGSRSVEEVTASVRLDAVIEGLIDSKDLSRAAESLQAISVDSPNDPLPHYYLGLVRLMGAEWSEGAKSLSRFLDLVKSAGSGDFGDYVGNAEAQLARASMLAEASTKLGGADKLKSEVAMARAVSSMGIRDYRDAYLSAALASQCSPGDYRPYVLAARALGHLGKHSQSSRFLEKAAGLVAGMADEGQKEKVSAEISAETERLARLAEARTLIETARASGIAGKWLEAAASYEAAYELDPSAEFALRLAASCHLQVKDFDGARKALMTLASTLSRSVESRAAVADLIRVAALEELSGQGATSSEPLTIAENQAMKALGISVDGLPAKCVRTLRMLADGDLSSVRVCLGPEQRWIVLKAGRRIASSELSEGLAAALQELEVSGSRVRWVVWPDGDAWGVLYDDNGYWVSRAMASELQAPFEAANNSMKRVVGVAAADGAVAIVSEDGALYAAGLSSEGMQAIQFTLDEKERRSSTGREICLAKNGCLVAWGGRFLHKGMPAGLVEDLRSLENRSRVASCVARSPDGGWCVISVPEERR
ncbi:MAG: hypothetical protein R3F29_14860 [Planctomycetota bacterium]